MRARAERGEQHRLPGAALRSAAMLLAATAGPTQVTTAKASEKKVWKMPTPTLAGSAVVLATPPTEQIKSVISRSTTARMTGVRCSRAACFSSRIQTGFGLLAQALETAARRGRAARSELGRRRHRSQARVGLIAALRA